MKGDSEREFEEEIDAHLELLAARFVRLGMAPEEARQAARRQFGNRTVLTETRTETRSWAWIETIGQDIRYGLRSLKRNPGFTAVAVATLALGIGANTAIFGVVKAVLLDPLPYADAGRLVTISQVSPEMSDRPQMAYRAFENLRERSRLLESIAGYVDQGRTLLENGEAEMVRGLRVTYNLFDTLGVHMQFGRTFLPEEDRRGQEPAVIILSHGLWVRRFGADPRIIGTVLRFSTRAYRVIGVLPASFQPLLHGTSELLPETYIPMAAGWGPWTVARLKRGVTLEQAQAEIDSLMPDIVHASPDDYPRGTRAVLTPLRAWLFGRAARAFWCVWGAAGFVLLIACANVANLVLARGTVRAKELALRAALGASRARLVRQLLIESLILGAGGGLAGLVLAYLGTGALASSVPSQIPRADAAHIDGQVLLFGLAAALLTGVLFGLMPVLRMSRVDTNNTLKEPGNSGGGGHQHRLRAVLVVAEVAMAFMLAMGAGVMVRSLLRLTSIDPGYDPHNVLTLTTNLWSRHYWDTPGAAFNYYREVLDHIRAIPGIEGAALASLIPMDYTDRGRVEVHGHPTADGAGAPLAARYSVSPDYFRVLRIPLKRGRVFTEQDSPATPRVAVINESFARARFPHENPIGKQVRLLGGPWMTVVGVVGDVRQSGLDEDAEQSLYAAETQELTMGFYRLVARTRTDPIRLERAVRGAFLSVDKTQPVYHMKPLDGYFAGTLADRTFAMALLGLFGALALVLATVGIYGVVSYSVSLRSREIGIRIALGARRRDVLMGVLREALALVVAGIVIGYVASLVVGRLLATLLFEVSPTDMATAGAVGLMLVCIALLASGLPAGRAASIDPVVVLREE